MTSVADSVACAARAHDPSLDQDAALALATRALALVDGSDSAELARALLVAEPGSDVSWINAVATATVEHFSP
jgi:hypothetical protein